MRTAAISLFLLLAVLAGVGCDNAGLRPDNDYVIEEPTYRQPQPRPQAQSGVPPTAGTSGRYIPHEHIAGVNDPGATSAVSDNIAANRKLSEALEKMFKLVEEKNRLQDQNRQMSSDLAKTKADLAQTQKELREANAMLLEMKQELAEWRNNVLGYRKEMVRYNKAVLISLQRVLKMLGAESTTSTQVSSQ